MTKICKTSVVPGIKGDSLLLLNSHRLPLHNSLHSHQTTLDCEKVILIVVFIFISKTISSGIIKERES